MTAAGAPALTGEALKMNMHKLTMIRVVHDFLIIFLHIHFNQVIMMKIIGKYDSLTVLRYAVQQESPRLYDATWEIWCLC